MNLKNNNQLHFEPVNSENRMEAENLSVFSEQSGFIESVGECLQEADNLNLWRPVCIYDGDILVGFAMYGYFPSPFPGRLWLDRLLIDKRYQGKGYGRQAVLALLDRLHARAIRLYEQIGFCFNGEYDTKGEHVMVYLWEKGREGK